MDRTNPIREPDSLGQNSTPSLLHLSLYCVFLFIVFYTLVVTIANVAPFETPVQAWVVVVVVLFIFLGWAFEVAKVRDALVGQYQRLLRDIYLDGLDVGTIASRYDEIKKEARDRLKVWRLRRRRR